MTKHTRAKQRTHKLKNSRVIVLLAALLLFSALAVGGTVAWLTADTGKVANTFTPSHVTCTVEESFNSATGLKSNVNVKNTGNTEAYIRVKLVTYRVNNACQHIGGIAEVPRFDPGTGWEKNGEYYYYKHPVKPGEKPAADLISSINLTGSYTDADGGKQVIEVMAEAIQAQGTDANGKTPTELAWGVTISEVKVTAYPATEN